MPEPEGVDVSANSALLVRTTKHRRVVRVEGLVRGPHRADVKGRDQLGQVEQREVREEAGPVLLVVVDDGARAGVRVRVPEKVLEVLDPAVAPVVGDHAVCDVEVLRVGLVPQVLGGDEIVAAVVGVDVVVAGVPATRGHVDPAVQAEFDGGVLAGADFDGARDRFVFETPPSLDGGLAGGEGHGEAAVRVEVVVLGHADDAGVAAVREVGAPVGAGQIDARRQEFAVRITDANAEPASGLGPCVAVDSHGFGRATPSRNRVEREPHPVVDGARLVRGAAVSRVHQALAIR